MMGCLNDNEGNNVKGGDWMRKELKDLQGCLCEQEENTEVLLSDDGNYNDDYTYLEATKDKSGLTLSAYGEGTVHYKPIYCPFCGRRL